MTVRQSKGYSSHGFTEGNVKHVSFGDKHLPPFALLSFCPRVIAASIFLSGLRF
ncbi:hypothetical protein [Caldibacillus debilis]|uniref:Uncharacterized protein n=1 Tax=Caldibacillus debilis TaxID=301148 RepID=A0A150L7L0_9BACI|nr:hypothetical protein [Caldibacillus debilis]KYD08307.1 hypothetical protein B4135_4018 [Caldibacillus debilis]